MNGYASIKAMYRIARLEFIQTLVHPLVPVAILIVLIMAVLNGAGGAPDLENLATYQAYDTLIFGFGQSWMTTSMICTIMTIFLGATMISNDRWNSSLNVLLTKPLYRRDYVIGKFLGLSGFMLLFNACTILFFGLTMIIFYQEPQSGLEFAWRITAYIIVLTMTCSLVIALCMLFGIISKNILFVTAASITYVFFEWIWYSDRVLGFLSILTPKNLYLRTTSPFADPVAALFNTLAPFGQWFNGAIPFIGLTLIEMSVLLIAGIFLFSREDNV